MVYLVSLLLTLSNASARPPAGRTSVVVVMKMARCPVCAAQLRSLGQARLEAAVLGITHDPPPAAAAVTRATGVPTYSHQAGIQAMNLWLEEARMAQPAVVVYDRCGAETGRIVGRRPGADVTDQVRALVDKAKAVVNCGKPVSRATAMSLEHFGA